MCLFAVASERASEDARSETADTFLKALELFEIGWDQRCLEITCLCMLSFLLNDFSQTEENQLMSTPQEQNVDWERGRMLRILYRFSGHKIPLFPPTSTTTTFLFFSSSSTTTTTFLSSKSFYKRRQITPISSVCSNVSSSQEQPQFSSTVSCLSSSSAPVSLTYTDSYSTTTTCISPSLIQCTWGIHSYPRRNKR